MRYFAAHGEDRRLDDASRPGLRGDFVSLSDGITHYELSGPEDGDLAILVGGLTVPLFYWDGVVPVLHDRGLRTLAYSGYGRGYSDRVTATYSDDLFVRQLTELIESLGLNGPYHVVGASMGALTAMGYATRNAAPVATLTLAGPAGLTHRPAALRWLLSGDRRAGFVARHIGRRWLERHEGAELGDRSRAAELSAMLRDAYRYEGSIYALFDTLQNFQLFDRADLYQGIGDLRMPTMLIWGRDDRVTPFDRLGTARALLRPSTCHVVECGHMVPFERPRETADMIASFVRSPKHRNTA